MSKQNNLTDFLTDVADAIRQKKGTQAPINPQDFSSEIASIPTGGSNPLQDMLDRSSNTDGSYLFFVTRESNILSQLTSEILTSLDFSNKHYTNSSYMFYNCSSLTTLPQMNFSSVTSASNMFDNCSSLTILPQLDFSNVTSASFMFSRCSSLTTLPQMNFSSVVYANSMFYNCSSLTTISQMNFSKVANAPYVFSGCTSLTTLDFSNIKTIGSYFASSSSLSTLIIRNPTTLAILQDTNAFDDTPIASGTGYIYVPDNLVEDYKQATNWSTYATQIKGLSELPQGE